MDTKGMNIAIYLAIANKANELFQRVNISAGTYSAKELAERKRGKECLCWGRILRLSLHRLDGIYCIG